MKQVARPPGKPLLIFDGECTFCRRWIARWEQTTGEGVDYAPLQSEDIASRFPELSRTELESAIHLIEPSGHVTRGAEAVFRCLSVARKYPLWLFEHVPGFATVSEFVYGTIARNRVFSSLIARWLWGPNVGQPTHFLVRWLFLRMIGLIYLIAFLSLSAQLAGLIGSNGIMPAAQVMKAVEQNTAGLGLERYRMEPTLCWFSAEDGFLRGLCVAGMVLSVLVILNIAPAVSLFLLWVIYLSLAHVSTVFLGYQWDNLLLETGFLSIFFAPLRLWPNLAREAPPPRVVLWLLRWLLFRLMFSSGAVKLLSGDVAWHNFSALSFHYETQPLPTPVAWYAHQLPLWFHKVSCAGMFAIELLLPFLILLPRRPRFVAFWAFALFMVSVALTGNYTFFNLLTLSLCVPLLDDAALAYLAPRKWLERASIGSPPAPFLSLLRWFRITTLTLLVAVVLGVTTVQMLGMMRVRWSADDLLVRLYQWVAPFRSVNS